MINLTLLSWNVNGIRAVYRKGFLPWLQAAAPDILCLQETKTMVSQLPAELAQPEGYHAYWHSAERKGYSGTALITREESLSVQFGLGLEEFDQEGRTIIAEYPAFTLINCYFPNGSRDHKRVPFKLAFYDAFLDTCEQLRKRGQPVIFCGDINKSRQKLPKTLSSAPILCGFSPRC
jgi:exodeoxyribonuclease-3